MRSVSQSCLEHAGCGPSFLTALALLSPPSATNRTFLLNLKSTVTPLTTTWINSCFKVQFPALLHNLHASTVCVSFDVLLYVDECAYSDLPLCSSLSVLRWLFASYWFPLCKATVSGTALTCRCVRRTAGGTAGRPRAAAAAPPWGSGRTWRPPSHRRPTPSTTSTDTGRLL